MTARLAQGDLDQLATRGRYLQMKYRYREDGLKGNRLTTSLHSREAGIHLGSRRPSAPRIAPAH